MKIKKVMRYDKENKIFRLFRLIWTVGKGPGIGGKNYDAALKFAIQKNPFYFDLELHGWVITFLFIRVTFEKSYGGSIV